MKYDPHRGKQHQIQMDDLVRLIHNPATESIADLLIDAAADEQTYDLDQAHVVVCTDPDTGYFTLEGP